MATGGTRKEQADYPDFVKLCDFISDGDEDRVRDIIDSMDFSEEYWTSLIRRAYDFRDWETRKQILNRVGLPPFQSAVLSGHVGIVRFLIGRGLDYTDYRKDPPLFAAVKFGHLDIARALVDEFGYDVNAVGTYGSVLHQSVRSNNLEICEFIFSLGLNQIDARNHNGSTAFSLAFLSRSWSICDTLVAHGADVNLGTYKHPNLYSSATRLQGLDGIKRLHGYGADPNINPRPDTWPLNLTVRKRNLSMVHYLAVVLNVCLDVRIVKTYLSQDLTSVRTDERLDHLSMKILLLKVGCPIERKQYKSLSNDVKHISPGEASTYINRYLSHPRSLADMCCFKIRRGLDKSLPEKVDRLPLPKKLIDFVKLTHVKPVKYTVTVVDSASVVFYSRDRYSEEMY